MAVANGWITAPKSGVFCMSVINIAGEIVPKLDKVAEYWPRTIQQYWRHQESRQLSLKARLLSESIRLNGSSRPRKQWFAKRQSFVSPAHAQKS